MKGCVIARKKLGNLFRCPAVESYLVEGMEKVKRSVIRRSDEVEVFGCGLGWPAPRSCWKSQIKRVHGCH